MEENKNENQQSAVPPAGSGAAAGDASAGTAGGASVPSGNKAIELIGKAWESISVVDEEQGLREPVTIKELRAAKDWLEKAKTLKTDNPEAQQQISEFEHYVQQWEKREFNGSIKIMAVTALVLAFIIFIKRNGPLTQEQGFIDMVKDLGPTVGYFLIGIAGYYFGSLAPGWLVDKRARQGSGVSGGGIVATFANAFLFSNPESKVKWSDGTTTTEYNFVGQIIGIFLWFMILIISAYLIPLRAGINALRNYSLYK
ncbi:MAG: hypothetical protein ACLFQK_11450 [Fibrobacterota bacterium]